jgi:hypothetical protein
MNSTVIGLVGGLLFALLDVLLMIPLSFADKRAALLGAFANRLAIGVVIGSNSWSAPAHLKGLGLGLLLSLPEAIITRSWGPILGTGALGGLAIGWAVGRWGRPASHNKERARARRAEVPGDRAAHRDQTDVPRACSTAASSSASSIGLLTKPAAPSWWAKWNGTP